MCGWQSAGELSEEVVQRAAQGGGMSEPDNANLNEVCLVDDDLSVLKSMQYLLASEGLRVRPFNKAEDFDL